MPTLVPFVVPAHHRTATVVSNQAEAPTGATAASVPSGAVSTIAILLVVVLLGFAVNRAGTVLSAIWEMTRMLFNTLGVVLLLVLSMVVLIGAVVVSAVGH